MGRLTAGKHIAIARSWDFGLTQNKTEQVAVEFEILEGEDAGEFITWYGFFTVDAEDRTLESLRNCGWSSNNVIALEGMGSRRVSLDIGDEEYKGKTHSRVKWVNRLGGNGVKLAIKMDDQARRFLAARLQEKAAAMPSLPPEGEPAKLGTSGPTPAAAPPPSSPPPARAPDRFSGPYGDPPPRGDDDIPF